MQASGSAQKRVEKNFRDTVAWKVLLAARPDKNLSALLIVWSGALISSLSNLLVPTIASLAVLFMLAWTTHLNVLADVELDRDRKPHLFKWLNARPSAIRPILWAEALFALSCTVVPLFLGHGLATLGLLMSTTCAVLYSHNPFAVDPQRSRLKGKLWGHPAAFVGGYISLWIAGLGCGDHAQLGLWLPLTLGAAFSDYGLYLTESAADSEEERRSGLKSPAATLGVRGCQRAGAALVVIGALIVVAVYPSDTRIIAAFLPAMTIKLIAILVLFGSDGVARPWLSDLAFHVTRAITLAVLVLK